jgi:hypothetical protein
MYTMHMEKIIGFWEGFFRWLGTPIRKYQRRKEEERQREEFFKNVEVNIIYDGKIYTREEFAKLEEQERLARRKKKK